MVSFLKQGLHDYITFSESTEEDIEELIHSVHDYNDTASTIHELATGLKTKTSPGYVPTNFDGWNALGLDQTICFLVMQQVFGSTGIVATLNSRKVLCALDMFDWEDSGAIDKVSIKMDKISPRHIVESLQTWLPRNQRRSLQDSMEAIGTAIGNQNVGFWGKMDQIIKSRFSSRDKKLVGDMVTSINQFYKATKVGGRRWQSNTNKEQSSIDCG